MTIETAAVSALMEGEGLYRELFAGMPCFVSVQDRERRLVRTNRMFRERFGEGVGMRCWQATKQREADCPECPVSRTFETGQGQQAEELACTATGEQIPLAVYTSPVTDDAGEVLLVLHIGADISDVKRLQAKLHRTQKRMRQLFDESPCYISLQDRDLQLVSVNRRFKEDFGDEIGAPCYEVYKHRTEPCLQCPVMRTFDDGLPHCSEEVVTAMSGERVNVLVHTAPIRDDAGQVTHVIEMSTNITQIRQLQGQLTSLGLLIGSVSHGVKGLLTGIDGGAYLVNSGMRRGDQQRVSKGWDMVQRNVRRVRAMVLDMLYYAKDRDLAYEEVHALELAVDVWNTVSPRAAELGVEFDRDLDVQAGRLVADPGALRTALINVLENAFDACRLDRHKDRHRVSLSMRRNDGSAERPAELVFEVSDNGIGMDRETTEKVFSLFFSAKGNEGTGLGLFISNKIVRQHGGEIEVYSEPGVGTRFIIRVPARRPGALVETTS